MLERISTFFLDRQYQTARLGVAFIFYLLILVVGSVPHARATIGLVAPGAVLHALAYSAITFLLFTGVKGGLYKKSLQALLAVALMGALDEYTQSFFSYRTAATGDWLVDCSAGLVTVVLLCIVWPMNARST